MIAYADHPDGGAIVDISQLERALERSALFLSLVVFREVPSLMEKAFREWARIGTPDVAEAIYAYTYQYIKRIITDRELLLRIAELFNRMGVPDVLAMQRALAISAGITTCDIGGLIFVENPRTSLYSRPSGTTPPDAITSSVYARAHLVINRGSRTIIDWDTFCVVPYLPTGDPYVIHPLQRLHNAGYFVATRGIPRCVASDGNPTDGAALAPRGLAKLLGLPPCA